MVGLLILTLLWAATELLFPASAPAPGEPQLAFWNFAIPAALSIGNSLINRGGKKKKGAGPMDAQGAADRSRGSAAEQAYYDRISKFDATEGAQRTADVLSQDWMQEYTEGMEGLRGRQVGQGRLDTGYGFEDTDRFTRDARRSMTDSLARLTMQDQGQQLGATESMGRYGERVTGRGIDLEQTEKDRKRADAASKRSMWGNIGGALIGAAGTYAGSR